MRPMACRRWGCRASRGPESFFGDDLFDDAFAAEALMALDGEEDLPDAVLAGSGEGKAEFGGTRVRRIRAESG